MTPSDVLSGAFWVLERGLQVDLQLSMLWSDEVVWHIFQKAGRLSWSARDAKGESHGWLTLVEERRVCLYVTSIRSMYDCGLLIVCTCRTWGATRPVWLGVVVNHGCCWKPPPTLIARSSMLSVNLSGSCCIGLIFLDYIHALVGCKSFMFDLPLTQEEANQSCKWSN